MSDELAGARFVTEERLSRKTSVVRLNLRLFGALPLFLRMIPVSVVAILLSSATPSFFRWYAGRFSNGSPPWAPPFVPEHPLSFTLWGLCAVAGFGIFFRILAWAAFELSGMWSSRRIHDDMVRGLSRARTTFFDENPSGRLINRLIRDFDELRSTAIIFVGDLFNAVVEVLSIAAVAALASPWAVFPVLPLLGAFAYIQNMRSSMLDHARGLSALATSQVIGRKTDLIEGREIFLLYGRIARLLARMSHGFAGYVRASALVNQIETWASLWIRLSAETFSFSILVLTALSLSSGSIDATVAGVIISALFGVTGSIGWLDFATGLISRSAPHVRRVFEFVDLPAEESEERSSSPRRRTLERSPRTAAPAKALPGDIEFIGYTMSYRADTPVILDNLSLKLPAGRKTALIGRTGSGKTSLAQSLMRMVHVRSGDLRIGGASALDMEIGALRRLFGVVPQFPYLFEGTIRSNLDRGGAIDEGKLADALGTVGLAHPLGHAVSEGGHNLSMGERQLVCLARVIAADRPIILMDEPTSGLDPRTDARLGEILRTALADRTVITIAHRRESLGHYDQVVEMSAGRVVRVCKPSELGGH